MIFNICIKNKRAFSLLELTIVLIILTVLLTFAVPSFYRAYLEKAAAKTALEIQNIQDAARSYYLKNGDWPLSIKPDAANPGKDLESTGYLPSDFDGNNPFTNRDGSRNSYTLDPVPGFFTVATNVSDGAQNIVASKLAMSQVSGTMVTSTISLPGGSMTPSVKIFPGHIGNGETIPLPNGYTDSQCYWMVSPQNPTLDDSSGKGGCENQMQINSSLIGRTASAYIWQSNPCRDFPTTFTLNYIGICLNS